MKCWFLAVFVIASCPALSQTTWQLVKEANNISVYTRNEPGSLYRAFKAVSVVTANPQEVFAVLDDVNGYQEWFAFTKSVSLIKQSPNSKYIYMETSFPWPFSNEDMAYRMSFTKNSDGTIKLSLDGEPDLIPSIDGILRMHDAKGYISLRPDNSRTEITYVMHTELRGRIPASLVNQYIHNLPYQTMENLIDIVRKNDEG